MLLLLGLRVIESSLVLINYHRLSLTSMFDDIINLNVFYYMTRFVNKCFLNGFAVFIQINVICEFRNKCPYITIYYIL